MPATGGSTASTPSGGTGGTGTPVTPMMGDTTASPDGGSTSASPDGGAPDTGPEPVDTGSLPPVDDLAEAGPFTPVRVQTTGPGSGYELFYPEEIEDDETTRYPIVVFGPGALSNCPLYLSLLEHLASHGFVVACYNATAAGTNLVAGIDWMEQEATSGMLAGKLDTDHIAVSGQSAGSLGTFEAAVDPRIATTVHLQGGTFEPHTTVSNLHAPAQFLCGETAPPGGDATFAYDLANPNCEADFGLATVPVFYGSLVGGAHAQVVDVPGGRTDDEWVGKKKANFAAMVGWLRWRLAGDETQRDLFVGPDCGLCGPDSGWVVQQKDLESLD